MAMYLGKQRVAILSQKYTTEKFSFRKTPDFGGLSQSTLFRVKKVKGATVKSKNLIPYPYYETTKTEQGVTWTVNNDGSLKVEGTPTNYTAFFFSYSVPIEYGKTYTFSIGVIPSSINLSIAITAVKTDGTQVVLSMNNNIESNTFTIEDESIKELIVAVKRTSNNVQMSGTIYPMLNEGETALPYQPYFTGLKHAYINSIKSTGENLFNKETAIHGKALSVENGEVYNNSTRFSSDYIAVLAETQYYINWETVRWACCYDLNKNFLGQCPHKNNTLTTLSKTAYIRITANLDELSTIMLNQGPSGLPFEPYKETLWQIPQTLELAEGDEFIPQTGELKRVDGTIERVEDCPLAYKVFQGGTESVIQGEVDNSQFGAFPTIETGHTVIMELIIGDKNG